MLKYFEKNKAYVIIAKIRDKVMERKKFNRGTVGGGIGRIVISVVAIIIAAIVMSTAIKSWDPESVGGGIFMCLIGSIMIITGICFIVDGIKMILNGMKSLEVAKKGHSESGRIIDLVETEVTEQHNTTVSHYMVYTLTFEYNDDSGTLCESKEQISAKTYSDLQGKKLVPILVYKERAVLDKKKLDNFENEELEAKDDSKAE